MYTMIVDVRTQEVQKRTDKLKIACRKMAQINPLYGVFLAHCQTLFGFVSPKEGDVATIQVEHQTFPYSCSC